ncbi:hypothetical protein Pcinc_030563 [Petrolisthes cinctipes]|uniref:VWFD domain-containing protein n=1 Tax=Petrolisthes cinctipes TaxID=88211 RepID=A0AAE1EYF2_PETCI|nr:hypothetical protein Pcinc_030563 [Petrolisthes cinctipes]
MAGLPVPTKIDTLKLRLGALGWTAASSVQKLTVAQVGTEQWASDFRLARLDQNLVTGEAVTVVIRGSRTSDFNMRTTATIQTEDLKITLQIREQDCDMDVELEIILPSIDTKILRVMASFAQSSPSVAAKLEVEWPLLDEIIKLEVNVARQGVDQYVIKAGLRGDDRNIIHFQGPITAAVAQNSIKFDTDIAVTLFNYDPCSVLVAFEFSDNVEKVYFGLKKRSVDIVRLEYGLTTHRRNDYTTIIINVLLPRLIDVRVDILASQRFYSYTIAADIFPGSSTLSRGVRGHLSADLEHGGVKLNLAWDSERDPEKKLHIEGHYRVVALLPSLFRFRGTATWRSQPYNFNLDLNLVNPFTESHSRNGFHLDVTTPDHRTFVINQHTLIHQWQHQITVDTHFNYTSPERQQYKFNGKIDYEMAVEHNGFIMNSDFDYTSPDNQHKSFTLLVNHHSSSQERIVQLKVSGQAPSLSQPLMTQLQMNCQENSYKIKLETVVNQPSTMFNWQLDIYPQGGIKTMDTAIDMKTIHNVMQQVMKMMATTNTVNIISYNNQRSIFRSRYHRPDPNTHTVMIQSPSRTMEGHAKYSPSEVNLQFYPNKDKSNTKYVVGVKSHNYYDTTRYEGHVSHPSLSKDMTTLLEYSSTGNGELQGSFELDIFPDTADKLTASLHSNLIANNTIRVEADLQSRVLQIKPRVYLEFGWAPQTKSFELKFLKNPSSSSSSLQVIAKYDHISPRDSVMAVRVLTDQSSVMDLSGVIKSQMMPHCNGVKVDVRLHTSITGTLDIESDICRPAFIKLVTRRPHLHHQASTMYTTKVGFKHPSTLEASISESVEDWSRSQPILLGSVKLASPTIITVEAGYRDHRFTQVKDSVLEEMRSVMRATWSWVESVYHNLVQEARQKGITFPDPELSKIMSQISDDYRQICQEVTSEIIDPMWHTLTNFLQTPTISYIKQVLLWGRAGLVQVQEYYVHVIENFFYDLGITAYWEFLGDVMREVYRWVMLGEEPELITRLTEYIEGTTIYQQLETDILEAFVADPEDIWAVVEVLLNFRTSLLEDLRRLKDEVVNSLGLQRIADHFFRNDLLIIGIREIVIGIIQEASLISVRSEESHVTYRFPLHKPVYSLSQALQGVVPYPTVVVANIVWLQDTYLPLHLQNLIWSYYNLTPRRLLMPYTSTAMVVADREIMTFDGAVLRVPRSRCKVVLTSIPGVAHVSMSHPQPTSSPEITFQAGHTHASISPDFTVKLNGQSVTNGERTVSPITVMVTPQQVIMESPLVGVTLLKEAHVVMVNVSGWVFNYTQGLLGSYDGEVANDWHTRQGRNASSLQQLVRSWQEDTSCPTPTISPVSPAFVHVMSTANCHFHLGMKSLCSPVVNPEPYLHMCYGSFTPFHAATAYRTECSRRGVPYPPLLP